MFFATKHDKHFPLHNNTSALRNDTVCLFVAKSWATVVHFSYLKHFKQRKQNRIIYQIIHEHCGLVRAR